MVVVSLFCAEGAFLVSLSFFRVAIKALHSPQSIPQKAIKLLMQLPLHEKYRLVIYEFGVRMCPDFVP